MNKNFLVIFILFLGMGDFVLVTPGFHRIRRNFSGRYHKVRFFDLRFRVKMSIFTLMCFTMSDQLKQITNDV